MTGNDRVQSMVRALATRSDAIWHTLSTLRRIRIRIRDARMPIPYGVHNIELTNKCPMRCVMCPRTMAMTRPQGLMSFELFKSVVDQIVADIPSFAARRIIWLHHFGESLVHPEFARFIRYGASKGLKLGLSLNPIMLSPRVADELLTAKLDTIVASLDGHDNASFARIRGVKDAFERSRVNLIDLLDRKVRMESKTRIIVSMIHFSQNLQSIRETRAFWEHVAGVDQFQAKKFSAFNGDVDDIRALERGLKRKRKAPFVVCSRPWDMMTITWNGEVVPCCYDYDNKYVVGDVNSNTLSEIWRGEKMTALRREFLSNQVTNALCRSCPSLRGEIVSEGM